MFSLMYSELNTSTADLEMTTRDDEITNTTDTVIMKNISYTTAEDVTQNGPCEQVPARTDIVLYIVTIIMSKASAMYLSGQLELPCYNLIHTGRAYM